MRVAPAPDGSESWVAVTGRQSAPDASSLGRWVATVDDRPVAGIEVRRRPDGRAFVSIHGSDPDAQRLMIETVRRSLARNLHVVCRGGQPKDRRVLLDLGFETTAIEDRFDVDFGQALTAVKRAWIPSGYSIVSASGVDPARLFELDNRLRRLVPGTEGWEGDRAMFDAELSEAPPFDASGYLVGLDVRSGDLVGLVRFWRNPSKPRLGMIAVLPSHRRTTLGPALLRYGLEAASTWGSSDFVTETSRSNRHVHQRLIDLGARMTGSLEVLTG